MVARQPRLPFRPLQDKRSMDVIHVQEPFVMRKPLSILAMALGVAGLAAPAWAQTPYSYLPRRLTGSDLTILRTAAGTLGPNGPKTESWHNPKTGNSGTVTFLSADTEKGMACRKFRYTFKTGTPQDNSPYRLNWCETSAGTWAIAH
jgi:hypothetical protein